MPGMTKKLQEVLKQGEPWPDEIHEELADAAREIAASLAEEYHAIDQENASIDRGSMRQSRSDICN